MTDKNTAPAPAPARLLRIREVCNRTGLSRATVYRLANSGNFPDCVRLGSRSVAWLETSIEAWIVGRVSRLDSREVNA